MLMSWVDAPNSSVYPSGCARATAIAPTAPPPPGRFSITNDWPSLSARYWPASRAIMSVLPPGEYGTITVTGRAGHAWARDGGAESDTAATVRPVSAERRVTVRKIEE